MNILKKYELAKKRNSTLTKQLENAKTELKQIKDSNIESSKRINELIEELEKTKQIWDKAVNDLQAEIFEYKKLNAELKSFKNNLIKGILPKRKFFK